MFGLHLLHRERGRDAARRKDWPAAAEAYRRSLRHHAGQPRLWVQYGNVLKDGGRLDEALEAYREAERRAPGVADTRIQMGHALKLRGEAEAALAEYRAALALDPASVAARREVMSLEEPPPGEDGMPARLRFVMLGTTGLCNASCIHCPTGKAETADAPRHPMPMPVFRRLLEEIRDLGLPITDQISLGLFGDALVDPHVVERAAFARRLFPEVRISVNTNGAAFNPDRHRALAEHGVVIALHCESLDPETYRTLMAPLRLERVMPKMEAMLATFGERVFVSVPVNRLNIGQLAEIRAWFRARGASHVTFDALSSRCAENRTTFDRLALAPGPVRCSPGVMDDLIVDCDGAVLACCQDFSRLERIGQFGNAPLATVLRDERRRRMRELFAAGRHAEVPTCARCFGDMRGSAAWRAHLPA